MTRNIIIIGAIALLMACSQREPADVLTRYGDSVYVSDSRVIVNEDSMENHVIGVTSSAYDSIEVRP